MRVLFDYGSLQIGKSACTLDTCSHVQQNQAPPHGTAHGSYDYIVYLVTFNFFFVLHCHAGREGCLSHERVYDNQMQEC